MSEIPMYPDECSHGASRPNLCGQCRYEAERLLRETMAEEADLAVTYLERGQTAEAMAHMKRVRDALKV
jgi:hypothetical protein